ncbi:MAG: LysR family transcriptional regulator [Steroidobacteraceae bacterium]
MRRCGKKVHRRGKRQNATNGAIDSRVPRTSINTLLNINAFIVAARARSFTSAARELGVAPSVVTKRITQLEWETGAALLSRSTRGLALTAAGERYLPRFLQLAGELEDILASGASAEGTIAGALRVKSPTTVTALYLGAVFSDFQVAYPDVRLEVVVQDRSVNPLEEGFDLVIGALPVLYPHVVDVPLCAYPIVLCAAPAYLKARGIPDHPGELIDHDCLTSVMLGRRWPFQGPGGALLVEVRSRFHANDSRVLLEAALRGLGLAMLPRYLVEEALRSGALLQVLERFPAPSFWLKMLVPRMKMAKPAVRELVSFVKARMQPAPWDVRARRSPFQGDTGPAVQAPSEEVACS